MRSTPPAVLLLLAACGGGEPDPALLWDPAAGELYAFPDDAFTVDDPAARTGLRVAIDPAQIPELGDVPETFQQVFRDLGSLDGFGGTAGISLRFSEPIDLATLGSGESTGSLEAAVLILVDGWPEPWPFEVRSADEATSIILEPMRPLPPATRVAVVVTDRLRTATGRPLARGPAMAAALRGEGDAVTGRVAGRIQAAAADTVARGAVTTADQVVGAVVFTTQSVHEDALAIAADAATRDVRPTAVPTCVTEPLWIRCEGSFTAVDYRGADGLLDEVVDAVDTGTTWELPFTVWLPLERPGPYGGDAFPVLIYGHGLGSGRDQGARLAEFAAPRGMATVAIDAVMHGQHPTAQSGSTLGRTLDFFAISTSDLSFQPFRMRDHFRQSTFDKLQLVRMLELGVDVDGDQVVDLDPERISYLGVSLGGIMGPELLALSPAIQAAVLVVPGGRVGNIVRDAGQFGIVITLMRPEGATDGDVERFFPVLQTVLDRGDAAAWAPAILATEKPDGFPPAVPHLLVGMVLEDDTVPNSTNLALARALDVPVVPPELMAVGLVGQTGPAPVSANLADGRTAGLLQFDLVPDGAGGLEPATHSNIGDSEVGAEAWFRFLDSQLTQPAPIIVDPYAELGLR